jgi:uncharacterized protein
VILYLDTSAIVKRYFEEPFSEAVAAGWTSAEAIVTSSVAYAETMATIGRKIKEENLGSHLSQKTRDFFKRDWNGFVRVDVTGDLNPYIDKVLQRHALRGFDAIHLASALIIQERLPRNFYFACYDRKLSQAARLEGLSSF